MGNEHTQGSRALVLGGRGGLLGQALVRELEKSGYNVTASGRGDFDPGQIKTLEALLDESRPDFVFNTVAYTQVDLAEEEKDAADELNRFLPAALGRLIKVRDIRLIHFSTDFVFDGRGNTPYEPDDPVNPQSVYGSSKAAGEQALLQLELEKFCIIRTAWLFGPGKKNFVRTILDLGAKQPSINVVHDQFGSPTYTPDLAAYSLKLAEAGVNGIFHLANSGQASWCELAAEAVRLAQLECVVNPVPTSAFPRPAPRPAYSVLDLGLFTRAMGITPRPWPQALADYVFSICPEPDHE